MSDRVPDKASLRRPRLTRARLYEIARFGFTSAVSAVVTLGLPILLHAGLRIDPRIAVATAFVVAFFVNFALTRWFVFRSAGSARGDFVRFAASSVVFRGLEYLAFLALYEGGMTYYVAQVIVVGVSFVFKFIALRRLVYGKRVPNEMLT